jgi:negative regulator of replication initiation
MRATPILLAALGALVLADPAFAACPVDDAKVETAIATKPALRDEANAQVVRDLRTLLDTAAVLEAYEEHGACKRVVAILHTLAAHPERALEAGDTDEGKAEAAERARKPKAAKP